MAKLSELLTEHIEAANVLVLAGKVEDSLEKLLLVAGRPLSNKLAKRMFAGMGPLSSFSNKIEVAFLFELIDEAAFKDLLIIKDVRNIFAHTTKYVFFRQDHVATKCRNLTTWKDGDSTEHQFYLRALQMTDMLAEQADKLIFAKAIQDQPVPIVDEED